MCYLSTVTKFNLIRNHSAIGSVQVYLILKKENLTAVTAAVHLTAALVSEHIAQIAAESFPAKQRNAVIRFMLNYRNVLILYEQTS